MVKSMGAFFVEAKVAAKPAAKRPTSAVQRRISEGLKRPFVQAAVR